MKRNSIILIILFTTILFSCSKNVKQDGEDPVIEDIKILNENNENTFSFPTESIIKFSTVFSDNEELGSYRMEVHYAGDGHRHYRGDPIPLKATTIEDWEFNDSGNISGKSYTKTLTKTIDSEATASPYHIIVYATDDAGNYAEFQIRDFLITRTNMPGIVINTPDFNDLKVPAGSNIDFSCTIQANQGVTKVQLIIRPVEIVSEDEVINESIPYSGDEISKDLEFSTTLSIPATTPIGDYVFLILVSDSDGNIGQELATFEIIE